MDSKQIKREEKVIAKEAKADNKQLKSAQSSFSKDKKKEGKLIKAQAKAEREHQKAIGKYDDDEGEAMVMVTARYDGEVIER